MTDDLGVSNHIAIRNGVCQYVRRVPEDLRTTFPFARVQLSLRTRDKRTAREAALDLDKLWDRRFADARRAAGLSVDIDGPSPVPTDAWAWGDWEALSLWFGASLAEEDWRARLTTATGAARDPQGLPWRPPTVVREHIARERELRSMTIAEYGAARLPFVQSYVRRLGIALSRTNPEFERIMAACLAAELDYLALFARREARLDDIGHTHPDKVAGPWRVERAENGLRTADHPSVPAAPQQTAIGKTLGDCRTKWIENRTTLKKMVRPEYLREMDHTIAAFEAHAGLTDIGLVRRRHVLAFRDHLLSGGAYKVQTVNKKVGFVSSLLSTALNTGWTETPLGPDIFLEVPEDEDSREPYDASDLAKIFAHRIFTDGYRFSRAKACGELQFWLPLIACLHGMISSEILQLGPDTIVPHPDRSDILCFVVTNAGDRRTKTLARRRYVPIRHEILALGFEDIVARAARGNARWLWQDMVRRNGDVTRVSGYFSSFWADFSRNDLKITKPRTSLYSFRHAFQDGLGGAGYGEDTKKALMGHAESGMTRRYGTKVKPRVVDIRELDEAVQALSWPFLKNVRL